MTQNNLRPHLSWLRKENLVPPVGASIPAFTPAGDSISSSFGLPSRSFTHSQREADVPEPENRPSQSQPAPSNNTPSGFTLPNRRPIAAEKNQSTRVLRSHSDEEAMARLVSASSSTGKPKLACQASKNQQLATPATSTANSSSMFNQYNGSFKPTGTTSSRNNQPPSRALSAKRCLNQPQTPRETPSKLALAIGDPIDLTGDVNHAFSSSKSSNISTFGSTRKVWEEDTAFRAEPSVKKGKKRKSDEIHSQPRPKRISDGNERRDPRQSQDFQDIDNFDSPPAKSSSPSGIPTEPPPPYTSRASAVPSMVPLSTLSPNAVAATTRPQGTSSRFPAEGYEIRSVTEETFTRRTISRVRSNELNSRPNSPSKRLEHPYSIGLNTDSISSTPTASRRVKTTDSSRKNKQQSPYSRASNNATPSASAATPTTSRMVKMNDSSKKIKEQSLSPSNQASKRRQKARSVLVIEDSDDDEDDQVSPIRRSPVRQVSNSPIPTNSQRDKWKQGSQEPQLFKNGTQNNELVSFPATSRVREPTRSPEKQAIGPRLLARSDSAPSPYHCDSPTRENQQSAAYAAVPSSQMQPTSSISKNETNIVSYFLEEPFSLQPRIATVEQKLAENQLVVEEFLFSGVRCPGELREQRSVLLQMKKDLSESLTALRPELQALHDSRAKLVRKIMEKMDNGEDPTEDEKAITRLVEKIKIKEREAVNLLHSTGAIGDGLFDEKIIDRASSPSKPVLVAQSSLPGSLKTVPSSFGKTQVVPQTQVPRTQRRSATPQAGPSSHQDTARLQPQNNDRSLSGFDENSARQMQYMDSPAHVYKETNSFGQSSARRPNPVESYDHDGYGFTAESSRQNDTRAVQQSHAGSSDFDDDNMFDDEEEIMGMVNAASGQVRDDVEDDYGDDGDSQDMLEFVEDFEQRQSSTSALAKPSRQVALPEKSRNAPAQTTPKSKGKKNMTLPVNPEHEHLLRHAWSTELVQGLRERFHLKGFRQNQLEAINETLAGKDCFVLMPTGGGKSLCYQLPAIISSGRTKGVTVVISPLLSLMHDQVAHLQKLKIQAWCITGETPKQIRDKIMEGLKLTEPEKFVQLLYVTPEMVTKSSNLGWVFSDLYRRQKLARIVIDEAHCVSQWGHDFRPDYKALGEMRGKYPNVPVMALTATATERVRTDVLNNLRMGKCALFKQSFNRPNLIYHKEEKTTHADTLRKVVELIQREYSRKSGIIYALSRNECEKLAKQLRAEGIQARHYHAKMEIQEKQKVQKDWQAGKVHVMVATIAFGMGIDKPDVRFVIHFTVPKSLEGYYQETGRAGRDGRTSGCYLFYSWKDTTALQKFIDDGDGSQEVKQGQRDMLKRMVDYCFNYSDCRRKQVLGYFGEEFDPKGCKRTCDNCAWEGEVITHDRSDTAISALQLLRGLEREREGQRKPENVTLLYCVDILCGKTLKKIKDAGHDRFQEFAAAEDLDKSEVTRVLTRLESEAAIKSYDVLNKSGYPSSYVRTGPAAYQFLNGRRKILLQTRVEAPGGRKPKKSKPRANAESTQVSSPVREQMRRRGANNSFNDDNEHVYDNGYTRDGFVVPEDDDDEYSDAISDPKVDKGFSTVRQGGMHINVAPRRLRNQNLGPPITSDARLTAANVNDIHREQMDIFVDAAKKEQVSLINNKGLKAGIFTERNFQDMALKWTTTLDEMREIKNIDADKVNRWGSHFIPLIRKFRDFYKGAMEGGEHQETYDDYDAADFLTEQEQEDLDPNHKDVVDLIDLCSDTETEDEIANNDKPSDEECDDVYDTQATQASKYFPPRETQAFNNEMSQLAENSRDEPRDQQAQSPSAPARQARGAKVVKGGKGAVKRGGKRGSYARNSGGSHRASGGQSTGNGGSSSSGVKKSYNKKASTAENSRAGTSSRAAPSRAGASRGPAASKAGSGSDIRRYGNGGEIAMMPTNR